MHESANGCVECMTGWRYTHSEALLLQMGETPLHIAVRRRDTLWILRALLFAMDDETKKEVFLKKDEVRLHS